MRAAAAKTNRIVRLAVLLAAGVIVLVLAARFRSPLEVSEAAVRDLVTRSTLVGLPLADAAKKLQHQAPNTTDGLVIFDFAHLSRWTAGPLQLDIRNGRVFTASWINAEPPHAP
ncbi:MAG: hypothetical protein ACKVW3_15565 [Phycisphaerales bacterium]